MKARIVRIGNSRGVRIPKVLLDETRLPAEVEILADGNKLVILPARKPRQGWEEALRKMNAHDEAVLDGYVPTKFDEQEWDW